MIKNLFLRFLIVAANLISLIVLCITGLIYWIYLSIRYKLRLVLHEYFEMFVLYCNKELHNNIDFLKDGELNHFCF